VGFEGIVMGDLLLRGAIEVKDNRSMTQKQANAKPAHSAKTPLVTYAIVSVLSAIIGFGGVYAILQPSEPRSSVPSSVAPVASGTPAQPTAVGNPLATGDMLTFVFKKSPESVPEFSFEDGAGVKKTLADWKGKVVLLNLWATWCAPCRKEMPALDRLQKELGSDKFEVVALSVDRQGVAASKTFLEDAKVTTLKLYVESTSKSVGLLRASGLPATLLIDAQGREVGRLAGPAEWDSADAKRLILSVVK
jgi:thiol-disulfide isomerase/thioredoxin